MPAPRAPAAVFFLFHVTEQHNKHVKLWPWLLIIWPQGLMKFVGWKKEVQIELTGCRSAGGKCHLRAAVRLWNRLRLLQNLQFSETIEEQKQPINNSIFVIHQTFASFFPFVLTSFSLSLLLLFYSPSLWPRILYRKTLMSPLWALTRKINTSHIINANSGRCNWCRGGERASLSQEESAADKTLAPLHFNDGIRERERNEAANVKESESGSVGVDTLWSLVRKTVNVGCVEDSGTILGEWFGGFNLLLHLCFFPFLLPIYGFGFHATHLWFKRHVSSLHTISPKFSKEKKRKQRTGSTRYNNKRVNQGEEGIFTLLHVLAPRRTFWHMLWLLSGHFCVVWLLWEHYSNFFFGFQEDKCVFLLPIWHLSIVLTPKMGLKCMFFKNWTNRRSNLSQAPFLCAKLISTRVNDG